MSIFKTLIKIGVCGLVSGAMFIVIVPVILDAATPKSKVKIAMEGYMKASRNADRAAKYSERKTESDFYKQGSKTCSDNYMQGKNIDIEAFSNCNKVVMNLDMGME